MPRSDTLGGTLSVSSVDGGFRGVVQGGRHGQVFGGQVVAQSLAAASAGVAGLDAHALRTSFLAAGDPAHTVDYERLVLKEGRAFTVVRVDARQGERLMATSVASFHVREESTEEGPSMPSYAAPQEWPLLDLGELGGPAAVWDAVEARVVAVQRQPTSRLVLWMRWREPLGNDQLTHASALGWMSDLLMVRTASLGQPPATVRRAGASLDHGIWWHRPARADEWVLVEATTRVRAGGRSLVNVSMYASGACVATSVQECLLRWGDS